MKNKKKIKKSTDKEAENFVSFHLVIPKKKKKNNSMEEDKTRNLFIDLYKRCCWFYNIGARVIFHPEALKNRDDRKKKNLFLTHYNQTAFRQKSNLVL